MVSGVKWSKALVYGVKFFLASAVFNVIGISLILSSLTINAYFSEGKYVIVFNALAAFTNIGALALLIVGFATIAIGNVAILLKLFSDIVKESSRDYVW